MTCKQAVLTVVDAQMWSYVWCSPTDDQTKVMLIPHLGDGFWSFLGASAVAGFAAAAVSTPADVLKTRLMDQGGSTPRLYSGMVDALIKTVRYDGVGHLYCGFNVIFVRKLIFCTTFFLCYEQVLRWMQQRDGSTL